MKDRPVRHAADADCLRAAMHAAGPPARMLEGPFNAAFPAGIKLADFLSELRASTPAGVAAAAERRWPVGLQIGAPAPIKSYEECQMLLKMFVKNNVFFA